MRLPFAEDVFLTLVAPSVGSSCTSAAVAAASTSDSSNPDGGTHLPCSPQHRRTVTTLCVMLRNHNVMRRVSIGWSHFIIHNAALESCRQSNCHVLHHPVSVCRRVSNPAWSMSTFPIVSSRSHVVTFHRRIFPRRILVIR